MIIIIELSLPTKFKIIFFEKIILGIFKPGRHQYRTIAEEHGARDRTEQADQN